mgnify:CR=1 FL=1
MLQIDWRPEILISRVVYKSTGDMHQKTTVMMGLNGIHDYKFHETYIIINAILKKDESLFT